MQPLVTVPVRNPWWFPRDDNKSARLPRSKYWTCSAYVAPSVILLGYLLLFPKVVKRLHKNPKIQEKKILTITKLYPRRFHVFLVQIKVLQDCKMKLLTDAKKWRMIALFRSYWSSDSDDYHVWKTGISNDPVCTQVNDVWANNLIVCKLANRKRNQPFDRIVEQ